MSVGIYWWDTVLWSTLKLRSQLKFVCCCLSGNIRYLHFPSETGYKKHECTVGGHIPFSSARPIPSAPAAVTDYQAHWGSNPIRRRESICEPGGAECVVDWKVSTSSLKVSVGVSNFDTAEIKMEWIMWNRHFHQKLTGRLSAPHAGLKPAGSHFFGTGSCSHSAMHFLKEVLQIAIRILVIHRHLLFSLLIHWRSCTHLHWPTHTLTHWPASPCPHIWTGACCPGSSGAVSSALPGTSPNSPLCSCAPSGTSSVQPGGEQHKVSRGTAVLLACVSISRWCFTLTEADIYLTSGQLLHHWDRRTEGGFLFLLLTPNILFPDRMFFFSLCITCMYHNINCSVFMSIVCIM